MYPRFCQTPNSPADYYGICAVICLSPTVKYSGWPSVICRVLPNLIHSAATRFNQMLMQRLAKPTRLALSCTLAWPDTLLHLPVGSYPTLSPLTKKICISLADLLSVAVVVQHSLPNAGPHLRFRGATFLQQTIVYCK